MADSLTETIKEKLDIVEFLRGYLALSPAGKNFKALCPFHREKTPSFMVSPERQSWHCFGCGLGGDIFTFLMHYENVDFGDALKILAEKAGVELKRLTPTEYKFRGLLYEINEAAKDFFVSQLSAAEPAKKYLSERGLKNETIKEFEIGWTPNALEDLNLHLLKMKFSPDDILRAGAVFKTERGRTMDRFRGRIMFPIHDHFGKIAGFSGRILPELDDGKSGKYVNSPETPIFSKSKILYGLWKTRGFIREAGSAFLVEGQMDFLMSYQAGIKNAVAASGTALTLDHLKVLRRLTDQLILSFDADRAGLDAGERAIDLAEAADFSVKVAMPGKYKDPAEAVQENPDYLKQAIKDAKSATEFYFEKYLPRENSGAQLGRDYLKNLRAVLGKIKNIASPVMQNFWLKELSKKTGVEEKVLFAEMENLSGKTAGAENEKSGADEIPSRRLSRRELLSELLLQAAFSKNILSELAECAEYLSPAYAQVFNILEKGGRKSADSEQDEILSRIVLSPPAGGADKMEDLKVELQKEYIKERRRELGISIRQAETNGDEKSLYSALQELNKLPVL